MHEFLGVKRDFSTWIKDRIEEYGFIEGQDYIFDESRFSPNLGKTSKCSKGGRPTIEYLLTIDMAKELGMVEKTEKGREIRKYFVRCEAIMRKQQQLLL